MSDAREIIARQIPGTNAELCFGLADAIVERLTTAGYRILGPDEVEAIERLKARADSWSLNSDSARVSVRLGDLRALGRKA